MAFAQTQQQQIADPKYKAYQPFGNSLEIFYDRSPEILICGPAGTGKSRGVLEKMHLVASKYPGSRHLIVRKTRESLTQSAMVTFEHFVVPDNNSVRFRTAEQEYRYSNGSVVVLGGMDKASKVLSSEYDIIYAMEATELSEDDYEHLVTRNRYGVVPYNQMISDCNPNSPRHWLYKRWKDNLIKYYYSYHQDNPKLFDHLTNTLTPAGKAYLSKLGSLTGLRRKRLFEGIWCAAEGMIYEDEWDENSNRINRMEIPRDWDRIWVVDFGFTNPFVWQAWARSPEGLLYRFAEIYQTRLLVEDACAMIKRWKRQEAEKDPIAIICDWDAEGRATLERHLGLGTVPANKNVLEGIEATKVRMKKNENGEPGLLYLRDSLLELDHDLKDSGKPTCTEEEIEAYEWADKKLKEQPNKIDDHGMDCTRYISIYEAEESGGWVRGAGA